MKSPLFRDVPPRAAAVVVALALAASLVTGAPWTAAPQPAPEPVVRASAPPQAQILEPLDLASLERRKESASVPDLFAERVAALASAATPTPLAAPAPAVPQKPTAPALSFRYLGRLVAEDRTVVFLESGPNLYSVGVGDTVDGVYRVEAISGAAVSFRYLPLDATQTLTLRAAP